MRALVVDIEVYRNVLELRLACKIAEHLRQKAPAVYIRVCDIDNAAEWAAQLLHAGLDTAYPAQHLLCHGQKLLAEARERNALAAFTHEQGNIQLVLKAAYRIAERRLGDVKFLRRLGKMQRLCDLNKICELLYRHSFNLATVF